MGSDRLKRELEELANPGHPRQQLSPMAELDMADRMVEGQRQDEHRSVMLSDWNHGTPDEAVGTRRDDSRPDPTDANLADEEPGIGFLRAIEPIESDDDLLGSF